LIKHDLFKICGNHGVVLALNERGVYNEEKTLELYKFESPQKCIIFVHSWLVALQRYTLVGKNKKIKLKITTMKRPRPLHAINVDNASESIEKELEIVEGEVVALNLKHLQSCHVTKEDKKATKMKEYANK
jgi:hypothetical protein